MSHIVSIATRVKDAAAVRGACQRLGLAEPIQGKTKLFSGEVTGLSGSLCVQHANIPHQVDPGTSFLLAAMLVI